MRRLCRSNFTVVRFCIVFVGVSILLHVYYFMHYCQKFPLEWPINEDEMELDEDDQPISKKVVKVQSSPVIHQRHAVVNISNLLNATETKRLGEKRLGLTNISPRIASLANLEWTVDGAFNKHQRFLTIGMVTARRTDGTSYLYTSLQSIIEGSTEDERKQFNVVIFITDFDNEEKAQTRKHILEAFPDLVKSGFMQIISTDTRFYPPFDNLRKRYGDPEKRVYWRSKQAVDYAFLWHYCAPLAEYVFHMEDDVLAGPNFFKKMKAHLELVALRDWVFVQFNDRYNAVVFRSTDLMQLVHFVMLFFDEFPIDWAMMKWQMLREQKDLVNYPETLFAHIGEKSSLEGQIRIHR